MTDKNQDLENRIRDYWNRRAAAFGDLREMELGSETAERWVKEFRAALPKRPLRILDIGTGPGFFAVLLTREGHTVTGIDLSPQMIEEAKAFAARHGAQAQFFVMDAMKPAFAKESFDAIVTRNLTWTLPDVKAAYEAWTELLVSGGVLVNFDANYGPISFTGLSHSLKKEGVSNAHSDIDDDDLIDCDQIKSELAVSKEARPAYDVGFLENLGYRVVADEELTSRVYPEQDYASNPMTMFSIVATKKA